jgi:hypothetical protein
MVHAARTFRHEQEVVRHDRVLVELQRGVYMLAVQRARETGRGRTSTTYSFPSPSSVSVPTSRFTLYGGANGSRCTRARKSGAGSAGLCRSAGQSLMLN